MSVRGLPRRVVLDGSMIHAESFIHRCSRRLADSNRWKRSEHHVHVSDPRRPVRMALCAFSHNSFFGTLTASLPQDLVGEQAARGAAEPTPDNLAGITVGSSPSEPSVAGAFTASLTGAA